jgi:transcriptional regulator with XRE-family HTH domain
MDQKTLEHISRRIVFFRKLKNLSQAELATRAEIPQRTYQRIEYNDTMLNMMQLFKIAFTEESTSKVFFSPKFSNTEKGMEVEFGEITKNEMSLVKYWEDIIRFANKTKYHIGYVQTHVKEEEKAFISLALVTSTKPYDPKSKSINYFVPLDVKVSIDSMMKISDHLSKRVDQHIHCHGHIG